jgi:hypothetical protein
MLLLSKSLFVHRGCLVHCHLLVLQGQVDPELRHFSSDFFVRQVLLLQLFFIREDLGLDLTQLLML